MTTTIERTDDTGSPRRGGLDLMAWLAIGLVAVLGLGVGYVLFRPHTYAGTVLQSPRPAPSLDGLALSTGGPADLGAYVGDVVVMYFGYTHCPDICPTSMGTIARARELVGEDADRVHGVLVTVDPERDTPEALDRYLGAFDETFVGVTGPADLLQQTAMLYGVHSEVHEEAEELGYTVDHTGTIIAIDPDGHVRVLYSHTVDAESLAADIEEMLG